MSGSSGRGSQSRKEHRSAKRSRREWLIRGVLALTATALGYPSFSYTLANVIERLNAQTASSLAAADGRIMAAAAWESFSADPARAADSKQANLAERALLQDPTAVKALDVLGLQAQLRSEAGVAARAFGYSVALSRRELSPQIWAIETAVARGDIATALHNYDIAMRTSQKARELLFPTLTSALKEPEVRVKLIEVLRERPNWSPKYLQYAPGRAAADPVAVAAFLKLAVKQGLPVTDEELSRAVNGLANDGLMDQAWSYYLDARPGAKRNLSRDPDFKQRSESPAIFDWRLGKAPGLSVAMLSDAKGGLLEFSVAPGNRATVVSQTQYLQPGLYRLTGVSSGVDQPERSRPYWVLNCQNGKELGRVDLPNSLAGDGAIDFKFTVPSGCTVQKLSLVARASDEISGVSGRVTRIQLSPESR